MGKAKVYFTKNITADSLIKIYDMLGVKLNGNVGIKVSTGEAGSKGYLKTDLIGPLVKKLNGTIIECNTAYDGKRNAGLLFWRRNTALPEQKTPIGRGMMPAPVRKPPCA